MDPKNAFFTRTIVGGPRELSLGDQGGSRDDPEWAFAVQRDGSGETGGANRWLAAAALIATAAITGAAWVWLQVPSKDQALATSPTPAHVTVAAASAPATSAASASAGAVQTTDLPITPAQDLAAVRPSAITVDANPFLPPPPSEPVSPAAAKPLQRPAATLAVNKEQEKFQNTPLMVLDGAKPDPAPKSLPSSPASPAAVVASAKSAQQVIVSKNAQATPITTHARTDAAVTIVDIARDGSYALVTNPDTRLPERVAPGQKIFTGETVVRIDSDAGKVQLDKRTIGLQ